MEFFRLSQRLATCTLRSTNVGTRRFFYGQSPLLSSRVQFSTTLEEPLAQKPITDMTNEELQDSSNIPGWHLIHSPPRKFPRGALIGTVVSAKMQKTVNVAVNRYKIAPKIRKRVKYTRKFMAHDENEVANEGDVVMITPSQRFSKNKHFMLREIIRPKGQLY